MYYISYQIVEWLPTYIEIVIVKSAHVVTSIKQSPVFKGHLFFFPFKEYFVGIEPVLRGHLSYKTTSSLSQRWPLNAGLNVYVLME